jgi:hypothetical protein
VIFHVRYIPLNVAWVMALRKLETVPAILF